MLLNKLDQTVFETWFTYRNNFFFELGVLPNISKDIRVIILEQN